MIGRVAPVLHILRNCCSSLFLLSGLYELARFIPAKLKMWDFKRLGLKNYLSYQPLTTKTEEEYARESPSSSSSTLARVENGCELREDGKKVVFLSFLCFSMFLFFVSLLFYFERSMSRITDKRCMYRMSPPSTCAPYLVLQS